MTEHKMLGTWVDRTGKYKINIIKKQEKIPYMIAYVRGIASNRNMGKMAINARLNMMEIIMIPSILYNAEVQVSGLLNAPALLNALLFFFNILEK